MPLNTKNMMDLKKLICDADYQQAYTYEQRARLFNKYQIPTNTKFLVPIWELAQFIISLEKINTKTFSGFGHGQTILNRELSSNIDVKKELRIGVRNERIVIRMYVPNAKEIPTYGKYRNALTFELKTKTICISRSIIHVGSYEIVRDLYSKIDEWLNDFGYENW